MTLTAIQTLTLACLLLMVGHGLRRALPVLARINLPVPIVGGLLGALLLLAWRGAGGAVRLDMGLQQPLMVAFFTSIGFGASLKVLRRGGGAVVVLLALSSLLAVVQGVTGGLLALCFGLKPLAGVVMSTVTLSGGPATGLAFAPQFEAAGIHGAATLAMATAMSGIVLASLFAAPLASCLLGRTKHEAQPEAEPAHQTGAVTDPLGMALKAGCCLLVAMTLGGWVSGAIEAHGIVLPAYVGAMLVASALRNADDGLGRSILPVPAIELAGSITLSLFLVMAMMALDLRLLSGMALPMVAGLAMQFVLAAAFCLGPIRWALGRDDEATVAAGGALGYMLGTTANAVAAMQAMVERHGKAPKAFLAVPLVGSFLLDFTNAIIITAFLNLWR
jgi:ESS family glutamate:Na+ symporter